MIPWSLPPDHPHVRLRNESYPKELQKRLIDLGADFAEATLLIEDGKAFEAYERLSLFVEADPAARFERARAALHSQKGEAAISDLTFLAKKSDIVK